MLFPEIKLFKEIAFSRTVTKGAETCRISQSAASQQIQDLEKRLGIELLDRSTRPLELTPAGRVYYRLCREVLRLEEEFLIEVENLKNRVESEVKVASIYSMGISELSRLQEEFAARLPDAQLHLYYMRPDKVYEAVLEGQVDMGLVSYPVGSKELAVIPWREEEMSVAASPSHPLASRKSLTPRDLNGQDYIGFDPELTISREMDRYFREQDVEINLVMQFDNIQSIKEAVAVGPGISVLPARTMESEIRRGTLVAIPLHEPEVVRPVGIVHLKRKRFSRAAQVFLDLLQEHPEPVLR